jgi:DNA polymerase alpha-associated DNA helicase A
LNDSQKEAIEFCLKAKDAACIHGPPGVSSSRYNFVLNADTISQTGKTHTLIELIFQLLSRPSGPDSTHPPRILITTPSNLALDNLLLRLHTLSQQVPYSTLLPPGSILRLGHPTRVHRDLVRETLDWRAENGDDGSLVKDVGKEIQGHLSDLSKKRGDRGAVKGKDRGKKWGEVRELRKEWVRARYTLKNPRAVLTLL